MKSHFNEALKFFDIHDIETNQALFQLNESDQDSVLLSLTGKLYAMIVDRVDDIDFGEIPEVIRRLRTEILGDLDEYFRDIKANNEPVYLPYWTVRRELQETVF